MMKAVEFKEYVSIEDPDYSDRSIADRINNWIDKHPGSKVAAMNTVAVDGDIIAIVIFEE